MKDVGDSKDHQLTVSVLLVPLIIIIVIIFMIANA